MTMSFRQAMSEFWNCDLGTTLFLIHAPQVHCYYALGWKSAKLLGGIIGSPRYEERWHERVLTRAREYGLTVCAVESTDSMLRVALALDEQVRQGKSIE